MQMSNSSTRNSTTSICSIPHKCLKTTCIETEIPQKSALKTQNFIPKGFLWGYYDDECPLHKDPQQHSKIRLRLKHLLIYRMYENEWNNEAYKKKLQIFSDFKKYPHCRRVLFHTRDISFKSFHDNCLHMLKPFAAKSRNKTRLHISLLGVGGEYHFADLLSLFTPKL